MTWTTMLRLLPSDLRESIAGDIEEELRHRRFRTGAIGAVCWAWWTAARLAFTFQLERLTHVRGVPPIGEELRRRTRMWDAVRQDLIFSARMLRRQPGFTAIALLALALGIGANTAIFSVVDAVLWRALPYPDADRVLALGEQRPREGRLFGAISPADFYDWRRDAQSFSAMAAYYEGAANLTGTGEPERIRTLAVSAGFLDALGLAPSQGRNFTIEEETEGRHRVVLLTDALWRQRLGAEPAVVGRTIILDGNPFLVAGVLPRRFWWPAPTDVLVPLALDDHDRQLRSAHFLEALGRLRSGVSESRAREELNVIGARLSKAYPEDNNGHAPNARSLRDSLVGYIRPALLVLLAAVGFVLLIACANVATLMLARASRRQKEFSLRRAVGATRGRLVQQMLTESLLVSFLGGAGGLVIAAWSLAAFRTILPAQFSELPGIDHIGIDSRMLVAAFVISALSGLLFGIIPGVVASDKRIAPALGEESRGTSGGSRARRLRSALVVAELAMSLILLAGAALLIVSFSRLMEVSPGFRPDRLVIARLTLPSSRYGSHTRAVGFYEAVMDRLRSTPSVQRVAVSSAPPFSGLDARLNLDIERQTVELKGPVRAHPRLVSVDYFTVMGIPVVRGRSFDNRDHESAQPVVVINETAARRFWPNDDPIGRRISLGSPVRWMEIIGIVGDIRHEGLDVEANPEAFMPFRQGFNSLGNGLSRAMTIVVRTTTDGAAMGPIVRSAVTGIDPQQPLGAVRPMADLISESTGARRLNFVLVSSFAVVALILTAAGLYGVMSYLVAQRTREIGVRMALGAGRRQVLGMVLREAGVMTLTGITIGIVGALALTQSMTSLLFGVSAADPAVYAGVSVLLAAVALLAAAIPSSRATRIDPLVALRDV
jgi:putative ABC transport system permease protein